VLVQHGIAQTAPSGSSASVGTRCLKMNEGYWALLLCILTELRAEQAILYMETGKMLKKRGRKYEGAGA